MPTLSRLILITHPMAYHQFAGQAWARPWIELERKRAGQWWAAMADLSPRDVVAVVSGYPRGPSDMEACCRRAERVFGKRCVILREPDYLHPDFWRSLRSQQRAILLDDLRQACLSQRDQWNKEEMETLFHTRRCADSLVATLARRKMRIDPKLTRLIGWGVEFEGCTAKYALAFGEALGLSRPAELDFDMCVPGAAFMLKARFRERVELPGHVQLYLFESGRRPVGLFMETRNTLREAARRIRVPGAWRGAVVRTKQDGRLWPLPAIDRRRPAPFGVHEIPQTLVTSDRSGLTLPICGGMVYRLAKAPAYLFAPPGMSYAVFRARLTAAQPA